MYSTMITTVFFSFFCFPDIPVGKESACNAGDLNSIPGLRRSPGEGKGYPRQYSGLEFHQGHKELDTTERLSLTQLKRRFLFFFFAHFPGGCMLSLQLCTVA